MKLISDMATGIYTKLASIANYITNLYFHGECPSRSTMLFFMTTAYTVAPAGDEPLTPDDAVNVLEEILEAQNQSRFLGLKLNVPDYIVTGIHTHYTDPKDRLYYVLVEFLKQVEPRPTWTAIINALRSPAVNLPQVAMRVEAAHFPDPTTQHSSPATTNSSSKYLLNY